MDSLTKNLQELEVIIANPNLKGGIWESFRLFIRISDGLLKNKEQFLTSSTYKKHSNEELIEELESIRINFEKEFGFRLSSNSGLNPRFESLKKGQQSHKFKKKILEFLQSYRGKFL